MDECGEALRLQKYRIDLTHEAAGRYRTKTIRTLSGRKRVAHTVGGISIVVYTACTRLVCPSGDSANDNDLRNEFPRVVLLQSCRKTLTDCQLPFISSTFWWVTFCLGTSISRGSHLVI